LRGIQRCVQGSRFTSERVAAERRNRRFVCWSSNGAEQGENTTQAPEELIITVRPARRAWYFAIRGLLDLPPNWSFLHLIPFFVALGKSEKSWSQTIAPSYSVVQPTNLRPLHTYVGKACVQHLESRSDSTNQPYIPWDNCTLKIL
jgi:hypothetical protein